MPRGGLAAYPSSVLMGVVPAVAAGVPEVVVCSRPGPSGEPSRRGPGGVRHRGGLSRLFALGGAGAVAALAYGTESVPRVAAIVRAGERVGSTEPSGRWRAPHLPLSPPRPPGGSVRGPAGCWRSPRRTPGWLPLDAWVAQAEPTIPRPPAAWRW